MFRFLHPSWPGVSAGLLAAILVVGQAPEGRAQPAPGDLAITGPDNAAHTLHRADLAALPAIRIAARFATEHGVEHAIYRGPLLWAILAKAGMTADAGRRDRLRHGLLVKGRDGYEILLSFGEIDPEFEGKRVILASEQDGKPLPDGGLRLIVPGDAKGGRDVRDVTEIRFE